MSCIGCISLLLTKSSPNIVTFVIADLQKFFKHNTRIYLCLISVPSLLTAVLYQLPLPYRKIKFSLSHHVLYFTFYRNITLTKVRYFCNIYYRLSLQMPK